MEIGLAKPKEGGTETHWAFCLERHWGKPTEGGTETDWAFCWEHHWGLLMALTKVKPKDVPHMYSEAPAEHKSLLAYQHLH